MKRARQFGAGWLAVMAAALLLLTFTAGDFWHHHDHPGPVCHICQTLHMPALSVCTPEHWQAPTAFGWNFEIADVVTPLDSSLDHRPARAPPSL